jgi:hypothetical protein
MLPDSTTTIGYGESFPEHEGCAEDKREVEDLGGELPRLHIGEAEHFRRFRERVRGELSDRDGREIRREEEERRRGGVAEAPGICHEFESSGKIK